MNMRNNKEDKFGLGTVADFPPHFAVELTNHCNLKCAMCPRDKMTRTKGYIDKGLFTRIFEEAGKNNLRSAWLHLYGEPLLHPEVAALISIAIKNAPQAQIGLSTNCTLLDEGVAEAIIESGLSRIILSFDGFTRETYEKIRRPAGFDAVLKNVRNFLRAREAASRQTPAVELQLICMEENKGEVTYFRDYWKPLIGRGDAVSVKPFDTFAGSVFDSVDSENGERRRRVPCQQFYNRGLTILWDGRVTFCCYDFDGKYAVGDLSDSSLKEIWNSERYAALRAINARAEFPESFICSRCFSYM